MRSYAGAVGPMQFLPSTFKGYAYPVPPGGANPPSPWDPTDAVYAAARMLCANGAKSGTSKGLYKAIYSYNHADWYVQKVLEQARSYATAQPSGPGPNFDGASHPIVQAAVSKLGIPYVWGGGSINGPSGSGFDCSGLTSYAVYQGTGHKVVLPRTSQEQRHIRNVRPAQGDAAWRPHRLRQRQLGARRDLHRRGPHGRCTPAWQVRRSHQPVGILGAVTVGEIRRVG